MARKFLFVDEAGNFDFSPKGTAYFILASIATDNCEFGDELLALRRDLVWDGVELTNAYHATEDRQAVRNKVYELISRYDFRVDATILEKAKTVPHRQDPDDFYKLAWYLHMKHVAPRVAQRDGDLMVVGASLGTRKKQAIIAEAVKDVMNQTAQCAVLRTAHWPAATDPCLQVADYCCWAIQRKWESNDDRSYVLIQDKLRSEFAPFRWGGTRYY